MTPSHTESLIVRQRLFWLKIAFGSCTLLAARAAVASPIICSPGYEDATCGTPILHAAEVAPTCSTSPGWTTVSAAQWIGSGYSEPTCSYQPPPTCPAGYNETAAPVWDRAQWTEGECTSAEPPDGPSTPTAPDGYPLATLLSYCGMRTMGAAHTQSGAPETWECTHSLVGASRSPATIAGFAAGSSTYWLAPSSVAYSGNQQTQGQWVTYLSLNGNPVPSGYVNAAYGGAVGGSEDEFEFACPAAYPRINLTTAAAYFATNPALIECAP
jgi:hypothetical protein